MSLKINKYGLQIYKETFPQNKLIQQYSSVINEDDVLFECTVLAGEILGVPCYDTIMTGDKDLDFDITYYQIAPDEHQESTKEKQDNYARFNNYFYSNYGKHKDRCYFDTQHEAFYKS